MGSETTGGGTAAVVDDDLSAGEDVESLLLDGGTGAGGIDCDNGNGDNTVSATRQNDAGPYHVSSSIGSASAPRSPSAIVLYIIDNLCVIIGHRPQDMYVMLP